MLDRRTVNDRLPERRRRKKQKEAGREDKKAAKATSQIWPDSKWKRSSVYCDADETRWYMQAGFNVHYFC